MKVRSKGRLLLGAVAIISASGLTLALPKLGLPGASSGQNSPDASASQDQLVKSFANANSETILGQASMARALKLKEDEAKLTAVAQTLKSSATQSSNALKEADTLSNQAQPEIDAAEKSASVLGTPEKEAFSDGLAHYARGVIGTVALRDSAAAFQKAAQGQISSASIMDKVAVTNKLAAGTYVATNLPGHITRLGSGLKSAVSFAQSHNIPVPEDATKALTAF